MNFQIHTGKGMRFILPKSGSSSQQLKKCIVVMKLTVLLIIIFNLQVSATAYSQQRVTLEYKNAPFSKVMKSILKQTGLGFITGATADLNNAKPVTITLKSATIEETLQKLFKDQPFTYTVENKFIIITPRVEEKKTEPGKATDQPHNLTGTVLDQDGKPLEGATVLLKGTNQGTSTDQNGHFTLNNVPESGALLIRMLGHETVTVPYQNGIIKTIVLREVDADLNTVQVIAYGEVKKKYSTSNIGSVTAKEIADQPVTNPLLALQGRVPGLFVNQQSGVSASGVDVNIQGLNSLRSNANGPLYVIDGVPYNPAFPGAAGNLMGGAINGGSLGSSMFNFINPADIESISVLKDADATAVYGSRAANGAILITTKKGKSGKTQVNINARNGWGQIDHKLKMLNTQQYLDLRKEAYVNAGRPIPTSANTPNPNSSNYDLTVYDQNKYTDWQKVLVGGTAHFTDIQASVSGGTDYTQFLVGYNYNRQSTVYNDNKADLKGNIHFNLNHSSRDSKFKYLLTGTYLQDKNQLNKSDLMGVALTLAPNAPDIYLSDGTVNWGILPSNPNNYTFSNNPILSTFAKFTGNTTNLVANNTISYEIIPGLQLKGSMGYTKLVIDELSISPSTLLPPHYPFVTRSASYLNKTAATWIIEPQLTYVKDTKIGRFDALLGGTLQQNKYDALWQAGRGYADDDKLANLQAATTITINNVYQSLYRYSAFFGRLNYRLDDKYILNFTARRDGSSRFGANRKFHNFYAIGSAWLFGDENIVKETLPWLSQGKLRANYGTTGNDQIDDYGYLSTLDNLSLDIPYQDAPSLIPTSISNPYLQWEETKKLNLGVDLGFLKNRISLGVNWYRNRSSNQLILNQLPITTGFPYIQRNSPATVQNSGLEAQLDARVIKMKHFNWHASVNFTANKNKLLEYPNLKVSTDASARVIGQPINIYHLFEYAGVNATTGLYEYINSKGEKTSAPNTSADRTILFDPNPKWYGGFYNTFQYKGFQLDIMLQYVRQKAQNYRFGNLPGTNVSNQPAIVADHWQKSGDVKDIQKVTVNAGEIYTSYAAAYDSDAGRSDASYLRLKNFSFSYNLPAQLLSSAKISNARIYLQGQNVFTVTNFIGTDPETKSLLRLPPLRVFTIGLQVGI
ncbi:TonB-linked outer membrane protein, SusC/RagA family [Chitinophaga sp. YR573]|uniref:SusC/RagA family TonB-linked outer membrane protein n=1 Tax=Chitinophaga sp. YR573 TaxID=1881040 RepID=UPI0008B9A47E|nr:SusC/RagA family TonB-linked outer membrane protein [Chitinophaga sp. YR573]SEW26104.1 TonB-linked outer membrane protein, SusC/RagA family [Chitinophaga sp. YR573]